MKRFRFTLIALCLVLMFLGWNDIRLFLENRSPRAVAVADLEQGEPPQDWLLIRGGYQDLENAISTSGTVDVKALLVPLKSDPGQTGFKVLLETRNPDLLDLFTTLHFKLDSPLEQERFLKENREKFFARRDVTAMVVGGLVASGNRDKLMQLAREVGMEVPEDVLFVSEGKEPPTYRGFLFFGLGLIGLAKLLFSWKKKPQTASTED